MSVRIFYFVHGTTTDNEQKLSTGWAPGELSDLGKKQAKELRNLVKDENFDIFFSSDLKRAVESADIGFGDKYKISHDERLRECNYGDLNQQPEKLVNYEEHIYEAFPNGESLIEVEKRIADFITFLKKNHDGKCVAIMAHKAPQLAFEVLLNNKTWEEAIVSDWRKQKAWQPGWEYIID